MYVIENMFGNFLISSSVGQYGPFNLNSRPYPLVSWAATYRIVPAATPGERGTVIGYGLLDGQERIPGDPLGLQRLLEAEWNLLLADGKALLKTEDMPDPDFTIAMASGPIDSENGPGAGFGWSLRPGEFSARP